MSNTREPTPVEWKIAQEIKTEVATYDATLTPQQKHLIFNSVIALLMKNRDNLMKEKFQ